MTAGTNTTQPGDGLGVRGGWPADSVHAIVTDPPYGLAFMGRDWDDFDPKEYQEWCERWATEAKRVLKPGGHLLAFSGNRTHHRLFSGVEDAGYEVRDTLTWHQAEGFPKALDVSKAIDKQADAEREVVGEKRAGIARKGRSNNEVFHDTIDEDQKHIPVTAPATDAAETWDGWKTALKPATEFIVLARKPLSEGTVAENVQTHGTAALNVGACRIGADEDTNRPSGPNNPEIYGEQGAEQRGSTDKGRYPSNVVFDEQAAERLDREVGELAESYQETSKRGYVSRIYGDKDTEAGGADGCTGSGGPSRYFYTSKASRAERTLDGRIANAHPTVKPQDLMEWVVKLVTAEGQTVLDPFVGSGTTCAAAKEVGRQFIGIEKQAKWADVARVRVGLSPDDPSRVRDDDSQQGLEAFTDGGDADD